MSGLLIYRPPGLGRSFIDELLEILPPYVLHYSNFLLLGDFNLHLEVEGCKESAGFLAGLQALGLNQLVHTATHNKGHTLYNIFTNCAGTAAALPVPVAWSDYYLLPFSLLVPGQALQGSCSKPTLSGNGQH